MRDVPLNEEDKDLFESYLNRTLYDVYRKNLAAFTQMWQEQGTAYWLKFCITFRSVLLNEGYPGLLVCNKFPPTYSEEFYIQLTKVLIGTNVDHVHEMIRDVVSISRHPQLMENVVKTMLMEHGAEQSPSCLRLFSNAGDPMPVTKIYCQLPLYLRAVGCLFKLLQRWLTAKPISAKEKLSWKPPQNWHQKKHIQTNIFETYLQKEVGSSLSFMLNIQIGDIAWWDEPLSVRSKAMFKEHHTVLGEFIDKECAIADPPPLLEPDTYYYHLVTSQPRGKLYGSKQGFVVAFAFQSSRGLHLVDDLHAFHPYSQAIISFYHSAFGPNFWYGEDGAEKLFRGYSASPRSSQYMKEANTIIFDQVIAAQCATSLNSHFYDTLYDGTTWTSTVTLIRLPWNMPLCINWMELLLIKIYEFERYLKPLRHFPVNKNLHNILQKLFYRTEEAAFLAKAAIILAENIHQNQDHQSNMCYSLRKFLPDVIKKVANVMQFLDKNAYKILNVILKNGWSVEEQETGEKHTSDTSRMLISLDASNSAPDIDKYFSKNLLSIYYWLGNEEVPDIENGRKYAVKVAKLLQNFISESSRENNKKSEYNFAAFKRCVQGIRGIPGGEPNFLMLDLLVEDGWISNSEEKVPHYTKATSNVMQEVWSTQDFKQHSAAYFIAAYFLGELRNCNISGLNALARLHRAQSLALMSDSGMKLSSMVQKQSSIQPVPPPRFFKDAFKEISNRGADSDLTIEDATKLFQSVEQVTDTNLKTPCEESLSDMYVPTELELIDPAVRLRWLECFERKRVQLLQFVSEEQFKITQTCEENKNAASWRCFPLNDVLEFRLVEEAAALRKTMEINLDPPRVHNLVKFLACRLNWIQEAFFAWKKKTSWKQENRPQQFTREQMKKISRKNHIDMLAVRIRLTTVFVAMISKYGTTHPICEITLKQMWYQAEKAVGICRNHQLFPSMGIGLRFWEFCESNSKAVAYCEQLILHCKEVWNVPLFNSSPQMEVHFGSAAHAEWIITAFLKFQLLLLWRDSLPQETVVTGTLQLEPLGKTMIMAMVIVTVLVAYPHEDKEKVKELKAALKRAWCLLINIKKHFRFTDSLIMAFLGDEHSEWTEMLKLFCSNKHTNVLEKLAFSEFINASESVWSVKIKQRKLKKKETKVRETVHQDTQVKEKVTMSSDKDTQPLQQEDKATTKEEKGNMISNEKDKSVLQECSVSVKEEKLTADSYGKVKESMHQENGVIKDKHTEQDSEAESKDLEEAACQQDSNITVEEESSANKEKMQLNKGSSPKLKACNFCKKVEKKQRTFKKCSLCKKEKWEKGRFFCSEECEANDWIKMHRAVHKPQLDNA